MANVLIVYWSGTGNTEKMAELIAEGATSAGAAVTKKTVSEASPSEVQEYDVVVMGSPSMGAEVLEESEMEPFVEEVQGSLSGRKVGLFGSYDWGDGEWMRNWQERMQGNGAQLIADGLIVNLTPEGDDEEACRELGKKAAGA